MYYINISNKDLRNLKEGSILTLEKETFIQHKYKLEKDYCILLNYRLNDSILKDRIKVLYKNEILYFVRQGRNTITYYRYFPTGKYKL